MAEKGGSSSCHPGVGASGPWWHHFVVEVVPLGVGTATTGGLSQMGSTIRSRERDTQTGEDAGTFCDFAGRNGDQDEGHDWAEIFCATIGGASVPVKHMWTSEGCKQ